MSYVLRVLTCVCIVGTSTCSTNDTETHDAVTEHADCSLEARCLYDATSACCYKEERPNPCCPSVVKATMVTACQTTTGRCLTFCNMCLPPGWVSQH